MAFPVVQSRKGDMRASSAPPSARLTVDKAPERRTMKSQKPGGFKRAAAVLALIDVDRLNPWLPSERGELIQIPRRGHCWVAGAGGRMLHDAGHAVTPSLIEKPDRSPHERIA